LSHHAIDKAARNPRGFIVAIPMPARATQIFTGMLS